MAYQARARCWRLRRYLAQRGTPIDHLVHWGRPSGACPSSKLADALYQPVAGAGEQRHVVEIRCSGNFTIGQLTDGRWWTLYEWQEGSWKLVYAGPKLCAEMYRRNLPVDLPRVPADQRSLGKGPGRGG